MLLLRTTIFVIPEKAQLAILTPSFIMTWGKNLYKGAYVQMRRYVQMRTNLKLNISQINYHTAMIFA